MAFEFLVSIFFIIFGSLGLHFYYISWYAPKRIRNELRKQGIAGPPPAFLAGNLPEIRRMVAEEKARRGREKGRVIRHDYSPHMFPYFDRWRKAYGPVFLYWMGNVPALHVSHPELVRDITKCLSLDLGKATYLKKTHQPLFGNGIVKSNGQAWAYQRKIIAPEFFLDKVKGMVELMIDSAMPLLRSWEEKVDRGGGMVEMKVDDDLRSYSGDVISRACFGGSYSKGKEIFSKIKDLQKAVSKSNFLLEITGMSLPTRQNREAWRLNHEVRSLIFKVIKDSERRKKQEEENECAAAASTTTTPPEQNLLEAILSNAIAAGGSTKTTATDCFIVDNCKTIYFTGHETTAVTATWCLMLLALHRDWQALARAEVVDVCRGGDLPDAQAIQKLKILTMVIQETLRLYPPGAYVTRETLREMELGGLRIPKGVNIYVPVPTLHHDPDVWGADVYEFNPERFSHGITGACNLPHMYVPFGAGMRTCLGQTFAMVELKIVLSLILLKFSFSLSPKYQHSPTLGLLVEPEFGVDLLVQKV